MNKSFNHLIALVFFQTLAALASADWGKVVYELTSADDTSVILEEDAMVFVLYQDSEHEDTELFVKVYESVAQEYLEHKVTSFQWFTIDT